MALIAYCHTCQGCGATTGTQHGRCDIARCAEHGIQLTQCPPACESDRWTGYWAGVLEAVEFGFFTYFVPNGNPKWQPCGPEHPEARPDLNRILVECVWDPTTQRYVQHA